MIIQKTQEEYVEIRNFLEQRNHTYLINSMLLSDEDIMYFGYFITNGFVSDKTRQIAAENNIEVMDGEDLVELIIDNLDKLSMDTKRSLGICSIPSII